MLQGQNYLKGFNSLLLPTEVSKYNCFVLAVILTELLKLYNG